METVIEQTQDPGTVSVSPNWSSIVGRVRSGDPSGMEELYRAFCKGLRYFLVRRIGTQDLDDRVHDIFLIVSQAIQRGGLRDPERLAGYLRTVAHRQVCAQIERNVRSRQGRSVEEDLTLCADEPSPENKVIERQNVELALRILNSLKPRDREVLIRFFLKGQSRTKICNDLGLTETQFRLIKSRAKSRFVELSKSRFAFRGVSR